ncbi:membrane carboxypeptidase [Longilinea arvoryzae]|uniref:Membrane carboxypeptidase n=1 Tax=Longilinea arvoryzae TaxID=360412 RepID=A0A0S7BGB1_9CHLR|nr:transglycosylase domain-containing protein [Longilinea arvoryzae]GAP12827.1 membrane carboxypeptidase [Longilinea arvoryzae]
MRSQPVSLLVRRRRRRSIERRERNQRRAGGALLGLGFALVVALMAGLISLGAGYASLTADLPPVSQLTAWLDPETGALLEPTRLYDRSGEHLLLTLDNPGVPRKLLPLDPQQPDSISPIFTQTVLVLNDPTFWQNPGFSLKYLLDPEPHTLAERLVNDLLLGGEPATTRRALRMRLLAAQVTADYGRTQVLEWYLNSASFGHLAYGVDSAAQLYLGKSGSQLDLAESALLAAALEAPALNPIDSPSAARERQQQVLERLLSQGAISTDDFQKARQETLVFRQALDPPNPMAQAFTRLALNQLSERYGRERLERGGLRILTSLDYDLQLQVSCALRTQLARLENQTPQASLPGGQSCEAARLLPALATAGEALPDGLEASAAVTDPNSGQVLALVGESTHSAESSALGNHEPGSLLSPFVAVAAFARGYAPASLVWDVPASRPEAIARQENPDGTYHGPQRLRTALANDYLVPLSQLVDQIGATAVWRSAAALGLSSLEAADNPGGLLYEGGNTDLLQIAQAYGAFASLGVEYGAAQSSSSTLQSILVLSVEDLSGKGGISAPAAHSQTVLSAPLAYLVHDVLSDETARWSSLGFSNALEIGRPSGAKIGQTADGQNVWTVGYTPQRLAAVWLGLPSGTGKSAQIDSRAATGLWHAVMQYASRDLPVQDWSEPVGLSHVEVCDPSGGLPTAACPNVVSEIFLTGNEPVAPDTLFRTVQINRETGRLATVFTPPAQVVEQTYMIVPPAAQEWAFNAQISRPPEEYDTIQIPQADPNVNITQPALFSAVKGRLRVMGAAGGDDFASYRLQAGEGINPSTWLQIGDGTQPVNANLLGEWDTTRVEDGLYALRLLVVRGDQSVEVAVAQVTVDNTPPLARSVYPIAGQTLETGRQVVLQAEISDAVGIDQVSWWLDGVQIGERNQAPFSLAWKATAGSHTLVVKAQDTAGNVGESAAVTFEVKK